MMDNVTYSIIIPHHNIPHLLKRCLISIPQREDLEVIVVDDKSDDKYMQEIQDVCASFPFVRLIKLKENKGGGGARNEALKVARGKFLLFSDADDFFNYCIFDILHEYADTDFDIVFFKASCVDADTYECRNRTHHLNYYIDQWNENPKESEKNLRYMFGEPWCKLIRHSLVKENRIKFDETRRNNDTTFSYLAGHYAQKVMADNRCLYCYTTGRNSVSRQYTIDDCFAQISVFGKSEMFFRSIGLKLNEERQYLALYHIIRKKDKQNFKRGVGELECLGYSQDDIMSGFSRTVSKNSILSPLWCVLYVPYNRIKLLCILDFLFISIPRFLMYNLLRMRNKEIRRW